MNGVILEFSIDGELVIDDPSCLAGKLAIAFVILESSTNHQLKPTVL